MKHVEGLKVQFVAGFGPVVRDAASRTLYMDALGIGFTEEGEDVERATAALESHGYRMLVKNKKEPWGQTVSRFLAPEGLLVGVTYTPMLRDEK
jgi:hypothetical protein